MNLLKNPKFLVVHYAPGSGGKFLTSILMCSNSVAHFDPQVESNKTKENCLSYIQSHFTNDIDNWMLYEPKSVWNTHFVSTKFARGNELTQEQFNDLAEQECTDHFFNSVNLEKLIPTIWHKSETPDFFKDSLFVSIFLDQPSFKWYHRALWNKHYGIKDGKIHIKIHDPFFNPPMKSYFSKFENPIYSDDSFFTFARNNVVANEFKTVFSNKDSFAQSSNQQVISLSTLLDIDKFVEIVEHICHIWNLAPIDVELIRASHIHWIKCHGS